MSQDHFPGFDMRCRDCRVQGWACTIGERQRPTITRGTQDYPVSPEALTALADAGAEIAAGLIDATDVLVAILTIEGYGEDMNVRLHRQH